MDKLDEQQDREGRVKINELNEHNQRWIRDTVSLAEEGHLPAVREALHLIRERLHRRHTGDPLFTYLEKGIGLYLEHDIPLGRALGVEPEPAKGGRPRRFEEEEIAATDLILRTYCGYKSERACSWLSEQFQVDRRAVQRIRISHEAMYRLYTEKKLAENKHPLSEEQKKALKQENALKLDELLITAGPMREKVARVLPQENRGG